MTSCRMYMLQLRQTFDKSVDRMTVNMTLQILTYISLYSGNCGTYLDLQIKGKYVRSKNRYSLPLMVVPYRL